MGFLRFFKSRRKVSAGENNRDTEANILLNVDLHCGICAAKVKRAIKNIDGVEDVKVDIYTNEVTVYGIVAPHIVQEIIENTIQTRVESIVVFNTTDFDDTCVEDTSDMESNNNENAPASPDGPNIENNDSSDLEGHVTPASPDGPKIENNDSSDLEEHVTPANPDGPKIENNDSSNLEGHVTRQQGYRPWSIDEGPSYGAYDTQWVQGQQGYRPWSIDEGPSYGAYDTQWVQGNYKSYPVQGSYNSYPVQGSYNSYPVQGNYNSYPVQGNYNSYPVQGNYNTYPVQNQYHQNQYYHSETGGSAFDNFSDENPNACSLM